ncbi:MAG: tyrosine-type recombinase/integrase [Pseudomonadota bacterium]
MKYVECVTAKGRTYHYFRHGGCRYPPALPDPADPDFAVQYRARHIEALGYPPVGERGPKKTTTLNWLVQRYRSSPEWKKLAPRTKSDYSRLLEIVCNAHGEKSFKGFTRARITLHVRDGLGLGPRQADYAVAALSIVFTWAHERELVTVNPCKGVKKLWSPKTAKGYRAWTDDEIGRFWDAADDRERMIAALAYYLALRPQDVAALTWFQLEGGASVRTKKRGKMLKSEIHPHLAEMLAQWPRTAGTIIAKSNGTPFDREGLSQIIGRATRRIGDLSGCTLHGLRSTALTRGSEMGATDHQLMALSTHSNVETLRRYTRDADKKALASAAVAVLPNIAKTQIAKP